MKGVGPFTHTDPQDRPPEIFGGTNTLHFARATKAPYLLLPVIPAGSSDMIRAAIVGLGRWGTLAGQLRCRARATTSASSLAHTRTRASAEDFCREQDVPLVDSYERHPRRSATSTRWCWRRRTASTSSR